MRHKMGIIGYGGMASWHRELIADIEDLEIAGIYDIKTERQDVAKALGICVFPSLEALLAEKEIEFVLIATPNEVHKPAAIAAMRAGKHVVCEKPVTLSSGDLQEMRDIAEETGMFFTVHQNRRWDEDFLIVKKILEENRLGEVFSIESRVHGSRGIPGDWRQLPECGGGMVLDWGVHLLDQMLLLFSDQRVTNVYASLTHVTNQLVDDGFYAELTFGNGVRALVEVGTSNFVSLPRWYVQGMNGTAVVEDFEKNGKIVVARGTDEKDAVPVKTAAGLTKTMAPRRDDSISTEALPLVISDIRDFYKNVMKVIEHEAEPAIKLDEVARVMRLMEAIFTSAKKHQVVSFE